MKVYIAGGITGIDNFKEIFAIAEERLTYVGHKVMNPAILPFGFSQEDYMHVCYAMIDVCMAVYFLKGWEESKGARLEHDYAKLSRKIIMYESV